MTYSNIPSNLSIYLLIAVGLRLGVLPLQVKILPGDYLQRGLGTIIRLVPPAASLVVLTRIADAPIPENLKPILLVLIAVAVLYGSLAWLGSEDELTGGVYWILAMAALAFIGAVQSQPEVVLGWSLALIYGGGLLFLSSMRQRKYFPIGILAVFNLTALPFSPTFITGSIYVGEYIAVLIFVLIAQSILFVGYIRHLNRETLVLSGFEPWFDFVYLVGLSLLPVIHFAALNWLIPSLGTSTLLGESDLTYPLLALIIALFVGILSWRGIKPSMGFLSALEGFFSLGWFYQTGGYVVGFVGRRLLNISKLIEGQGGILWALLILVILVSILFNIDTGIGG